MKIFIEGTAILTDKRSGVGQYTKRLLEAMAKVAPKNEYTVFGFHFFMKRNQPPKFVNGENINYRFVRWLPGRGYNLLFKKDIKLPIDALLRKKPDIVFFPNFVHWPLLGKVRSVIVIHDIAFEYFPQYIDAKNLRYLKKYVPYSIKKTDHIIAVSQYTKKDIVAHYGVDPAKISVVPPALDHSDYYPRSQAQVDKVRQQYALPKQYVLFVSNIEPRKNIVGLLDAYASLPAAIQEKFPLIFAGGKGWADEEIMERFEKYKDLPIKRLGYVSDEDMAPLFTGASLFVYPSFYEGFGMPPLEAMACGVPVITSNNSSLPEVVGDAAITIDPHSTESIAAAMLKVLSNPNLVKTMRQKSLKQAKQFTWENSAKEALAVFASLKKQS